MRVLLVQKNGSFLTGLPVTRIPEMLAAPDSLTWLDICEPDEDDLALLRDSFHFHPLAIEDATRSHERPKVDVYAASEVSDAANGHNYYFIVFYTAGYNTAEDQVEIQPLGLFIGANYLVTVHQSPIAHIPETAQRWLAPNSPLGRRSGALVHALLDAIVDDYFPLMDQVADRLEDLEDSIFVEFDRASIQAIFALKKSLLSMRRVVAPERDVINVLLRRQLPVFSNTDVAYLQDVYDHLARVTDNVDTYRDLLSSALDSYLSLQSNNLNQVMKILTMASIVLMTDALIAGIYGMNFVHIPELQWAFGYGWALLLMLTSSLGLVVYFRYKKWL